MRHFSETLTNEQTVFRMVRALKGVAIGYVEDRLTAYEAAGIPSESVRDFDADALYRERIRRHLFPDQERANGRRHQH